MQLILNQHIQITTGKKLHKLRKKISLKAYLFCFIIFVFANIQKAFLRQVFLYAKGYLLDEIRHNLLQYK